MTLRPAREIVSFGTPVGETDTPPIVSPSMSVRPVGTAPETAINVAASAQYNIELRASSQFSTSAFHIEIDGQNVTGTVNVPNTGDWNTFQWVGKTGVPLAAGQHVLKIVADQQYFNLN